MSEAVEQSIVIDWAELMKRRYPCLEWLYAIPNGGSRHPAEAANLKRQGVKAGIADLCLPYPTTEYHGLFIEMKYGKNKPTYKQKEFLRYADEQGYKTVVCWTATDAIMAIQEYLDGWKRL